MGDVKERDTVGSSRNGHITVLRGKHKGENLASAFLFRKTLRLTKCDRVPCVWSKVCIVTMLRSGRPRNRGLIAVRGIKRSCMKMTSQNYPAPRLWMNGALFPLPHARCMACTGSSLASLNCMYDKLHTCSLALDYKPECRGFDSRWGHWDILLT